MEEFTKQLKGKYLGLETSTSAAFDPRLRRVVESLNLVLPIFQGDERATYTDVFRLLDDLTPLRDVEGMSLVTGPTYIPGDAMPDIEAKHPICGYMLRLESTRY